PGRDGARCHHARRLQRRVRRLPVRPRRLRERLHRGSRALPARDGRANGHRPRPARRRQPPRAGDRGPRAARPDREGGALDAEISGARHGGRPDSQGRVARDQESAAHARADGPHHAPLAHPQRGPRQGPHHPPAHRPPPPDARGGDRLPPGLLGDSHRGLAPAARTTHLHRDQRLPRAHDEAQRPRSRARRPGQGDPGRRAAPAAPAARALRLRLHRRRQRGLPGLPALARAQARRRLRRHRRQHRHLPQRGHAVPRARARLRRLHEPRARVRRRRDGGQPIPLAAYLNPGTNLGAAVDLARTADRLDYDSVWVTHGLGRDSFVLLAAYAAATTRVGLGNGVVPIYPRHPVAMAQAASTLNEVSGGRFRLGIGVSHKNAMEALLGLERGRRRAGKPLTGFEIVAAVPLAVTDDRPAAMAAFRAELTRYVEQPFYRAMLQAAGLGDGVAAFDRDRRVPDALAEALGGIGDPRAARTYVEAYRKAGVTLPAVRPITFPPPPWYRRPAR